jgi:hypothetical protein
MLTGVGGGASMLDTAALRKVTSRKEATVDFNEL